MENIKSGKKPLAGFPVAATSRTEEAENFIRQLIADARINRVDDRRNFRLELNAVHFKHSSLIYNYFGSETKLTTTQEPKHAIFVTGIGAPIALNIDNQSHVVTQNNAVIIAPAKKIRVERPSHSEILYLRVPISDLSDHFEKLTARHHRGPLIFNREVRVLKGPGAMLKGLMDNLVNTFDLDASVMKNPALRESFDHLLMTAMLSLPHNKRDVLCKDRSRSVAPAIVNRAEEYMRAHLEKPINICELLRIADCSRSVLFSAFRNARGFTPMEFLNEQRLHHARELLLKSKYNASVSSIASNSGFVSFGWFSQVYKKRFGERPSDTLRKGK